MPRRNRPPDRQGAALQAASLSAPPGVPQADRRIARPQLPPRLHRIRPADVQLFTANALWTQTGERILPDFQKRIEINYQGGLYPVDFRHAPEEARQTINAWVEEQTKGKIKDLLKSTHIDPHNLACSSPTRFISTRSGPAHFRRRRLAQEVFHASPRDIVRVEMMKQTGRFRYFDEGSFQALELPYKGDTLAMVILLPKAKDGLRQLESSLNAAEDRELADEAVIAPCRREPSQVQADRGVRAQGCAFRAGDARGVQAGQADFSGITGTRELAISAVVHKAFVEVEERGTEAAAATGVVAYRTAAIAQPPVVFRADHPFFFLIRDTRTGSILFLGRLVKP